MVLLSGSLRVAGALPSGARVRSGLKCRLGVGGVRGGPWTAPLGAPSDLKPPLCPLRVSRGTPPVASCPLLGAPMAGTVPRLCAVPPLPDHAPGVLLPPQLRQRDARRRTLGRPGADVPRPPRGEGGLGGERLGGLVWVWLGFIWARYFAPPLPLAAAAAAPGEAHGARAGSVPRARGVPGAAAWPAVAVARLAGAAVSTPCALSPPSPAAAVAPGEAPGACAGATPRADGAPGATVGAAARLAGAAVSAPCAPGAPSRGGAAGLAAWAAGSVSSAGAGPRVDGSVSAEAARGCPAGGPTGTAASASLRSSRSARVSPAYPRETGEREPDRRWWRSSRCGGPSESDITVVLVGMRGGRCALPATSRCICVVPWAVLCSAPRGGGGEGMGGWRWRQPRAGGGRWPSIGTAWAGGGATRPSRRATRPSLGQGSGPWAPGGRRVVPGGAALVGSP